MSEGSFEVNVSELVEPVDLGMGGYVGLRGVRFWDSVRDFRDPETGEVWWSRIVSWRGWVSGKQYGNWCIVGQGKVRSEAENVGEGAVLEAYDVMMRNCIETVRGVLGFAQKE